VSARQELQSKPGRAGAWLSGIAWLLALILVGVAGFLAWSTRLDPPATRQAKASVPKAEVASQPPTQEEATLPNFDQASLVDAIFRRPVLHTIIPDRPREEVRDYVVSRGDSIFAIATKFSIKPDTVLWANYDLLNDNPDMISLGMQLKIPPTNGVLYKWKEGDSLDAVASTFEAKKEDILSFSGNQLDLTNPNIQPGTLVMVPGGHREFRQWIIPTIPRGKAGVSVGLYGAGACAGGYGGANGSGAFVWPAGNHYLSGNDYWGGHLGIDIAAGEGAPIYAADSGVVVFSGWANGGYGYIIMIDHGNGYQTLYGHLSSISAGCGQSVGQGGTIGYGGSTGNSTGPHLHFEVRYQGGFVNPWYVLPAP
jgi:murein DD-endopeptidase MepM/ murein hydrolase activator NlpD